MNLAFQCCPNYNSKLLDYEFIITMCGRLYFRGRELHIVGFSKQNFLSYETLWTQRLRHMIMLFFCTTLKLELYNAYKCDIIQILKRGPDLLIIPRAIKTSDSQF